MNLPETSLWLKKACDDLSFAPPVAQVYQPLEYAWAPHQAYLTRYGALGAKSLLLGMNPGPFGMAQTGVPFGDIKMVRDFLGIEGKVTRPADEHPQRPITGFACKRSEVSGTRLWSWAQARFGQAERFFQHFFVANYCPLVFMGESGANLTPDKLPRSEREALEAVCDEGLRRVVAALGVHTVIGVGGFAEKAAKRALEAQGLRVVSILHPSPASPKANAGWAPAIEAQLQAYGLLP